MSRRWYRCGMRVAVMLLIQVGLGSVPAHGAGTCDWPLVSDPDTANVAYPDKYAVYWLGAVSAAVPGTRFRIEGEYPAARYFSFNVYDAAQRPTDGIADYLIDADGEGQNPFRHDQDPVGEGIGDPYTLFVEVGARQEPRADNTIYTGEVALPGGAGGVHNPTFVILYRIYVPRDFTAPEGGVSLPRISQETADGNTEILQFERCGPFTPSTGSALNDAVKAADFPQGLAVVPYRLGAGEPAAERFYGLPDTVRRFGNNIAGQEVFPRSALTAGNGGGFLSNVDNAYVTILYSREKAPLYVVRARAPVFEGDARQVRGVQPEAAGMERHLGRRQRGRPYADADLRYWSVCSNHFETQRYVDCLADYEMQLDAGGWFTLVVSDTGSMPDNIGATPGLNWLPWGGPYYDSLLIYRHMLPAEAFAQAIQNVGYDQSVADVMADYYPDSVPCTRAIIESAGNSAAAVWQACKRAYDER